MSKSGHLGLDVGSTTVKLVYIDDTGNIGYSRYERHHSAVREKTEELLHDALGKLGDVDATIALSGSAGLGVAKEIDIPFVQEVFATKTACTRLLPDIDAAIELGGEDAKILFFTNGNEERMNGSCAGGTGAFIDQMASLLGLSLDELDSLSLKHKELYPIASRCGVFAKSDIQPLINQGAGKPDMCASIYQSIVEQTVAGLAQGREITGKIAFLGGPLTFMLGLRKRFIETLKLTAETAIFPQMAEFYVAIGAALLGTERVSLSELAERFDRPSSGSGYVGLPPLFSDGGDLEEFRARHDRADVVRRELSDYSGTAYLGIDAGSTTTKLALVAPDGALLYSYYMSNKGEPLSLLKTQLARLYELCGERVTIGGAAVTGYGEDLIKHAFGLDAGIVETTAHYTAARFFAPNVDFILDIGGQDMKCFRLEGGRVTSILLNEACSSGCGSFIEAFASALGYGVADFAALGLTAAHPVDLGSRCTVFMNSSVKQAQKDGATVADISAGLAMSVVKNALYKVIRQPIGEPPGEHIVVQGGTFLNDCVLRSLEVELNVTVTRPRIAGLMGAYGAALYSRDLGLTKSGLISPERLVEFTHKSSSFACQMCPNHCRVTRNVFPDGSFLSGNRCEKPLGAGGNALPDAFEFKKDLLLNLKPLKAKTRARIGIPMGLNMWENLPFWNAILTHLGFEVVLSPLSNRALYAKGQNSIPSDTACYPAKLMHGHVESLLEMKVDAIFYPCMTYNFDEGTGDNHYNCAVVAYYPELIAANMDHLREKTRFLFPHFAPAFRETFTKAAVKFFGEEFGIPKGEIPPALEQGFRAYEEHRDTVKTFGERAIRTAREKKLPIFVLAGRPYHIDPEINHGIHQLLTTLGGVVLSEDCVSLTNEKTSVRVLNQWTYHARLYSSAEIVGKNPDMQLIQLVSFGCGLDAVTTDEVKSILEKNGKFYTQLKIDEINNLGAARIRLRSLLEAIRGEKNYGKVSA
ncbi:2-hydroxyglutaryl-CoA dehydratase [Clostridia bacterium]|nr:2-hydroxyglutaryl-CoA dehydratase [Clostridia bacterium]